MKKLFVTIMLGVVIAALICATYNNKVKCESNEMESEQIVSSEPCIIDLQENSMEVEPIIVPYYCDLFQLLSEEDCELLARLTRLEAEDQPLDGQMAVIEVVFNRILSDEFPNTLQEVIYQPNQFSPADFLPTTKPLAMQYRAVSSVLCEAEPIVDPGVVFFDTKPYNDHIFAKIGDHYFCYSEKSYQERNTQ